MEAFHEKLLRLAAVGKLRISEHGYDELAEDGLFARELVAGLASASVIEDYPKFAKGPCALFLQTDMEGKPVHAVWGSPKGYDEPAVLVTAYCPDATRWDASFRKRLKP